MVFGFFWFSITALWFKRQQIQMYRQGQLLCFRFREKKTREPSFLEANSIGKWLNSAQICQQKHHIT